MIDASINGSYGVTLKTYVSKSSKEASLCMVISVELSVPREERHTGSTTAATGESEPDKS